MGHPAPAAIASQAVRSAAESPVMRLWFDVPCPRNSSPLLQLSATARSQASPNRVDEDRALFERLQATPPVRDSETMAA
jgi:hypothetical protein